MINCAVAEKAKNILLVEDDDNEREFYKQILVSYGYSVHTSTNGLDAIEKLNNGYMFDAIVSDLETTGCSGAEFTDWIRLNFPDMPIILVDFRYQYSR